MNVGPIRCGSLNNRRTRGLIVQIMDYAIADESATLVREDMVDLKVVMIAGTGTYHVLGEIVPSGDGIAGLCRSRVKIHNLHCHWIQQV